jgi:hypothetical protein
VFRNYWKAVLPAKWQFKLEEMKIIYSSSEMAGGFTKGQEDFEACATAAAEFDEKDSFLVMELDSFIRPVDLVSKVGQLQVGWLPKKENIKEIVSPEEAPALARKIFHHWVHKIQRAIPLSLYN